MCIQISLYFSCLKELISFRITVLALEIIFLLSEECNLAYLFNKGLLTPVLPPKCYIAFENKFISFFGGHICTLHKFNCSLLLGLKEAYSKYSILIYLHLIIFLLCCIYNLLLIPHTLQLFLSFCSFIISI